MWCWKVFYKLLFTTYSHFVQYCIPVRNMWWRTLWQLQQRAQRIDLLHVFDLLFPARQIPKTLAINSTFNSKSKLQQAFDNEKYSYKVFEENEQTSLRILNLINKRNNRRTPSFWNYMLWFVRQLTLYISLLDWEFWKIRISLTRYKQNQIKNWIFIEKHEYIFVKKINYSDL